MCVCMHKVMVLAGYKGGFIIRKYSESAEGEALRSQDTRTQKTNACLAAWVGFRAAQDF